MNYDFIGALLSFTSTYFFVRLDNRAWPIGICATCLNGWLYWSKGIYADTFLESFYFLSMCYGWYRWKYYRTSTSTSLPIQKLGLRQWVLLVTILCLLISFLHTLLTHFTQSNVAFLDATTTSLSLVAQWLICHKILATWILWFLTDVLYVFMYFNKELPFHSALTLIYTGMAITGYILWSRQYKKTVNVLGHPQHEDCTILKESLRGA